MPVAEKLAEKKYFRMAASLVSAVLLGFAYSLEPHFIFAWFAMIPILVVAYLSPPKEGFIYGALTGMVASLSLFPYMTRLSGPFIAALISAGRGLQWAVLIGAAAFLYKRLSPYVSVFVFPLLLTSGEFILSVFSPHGTGGSLAYSQMDFLPIAQLAAFGGISLIIFMLALFNAAIAHIICTKQDRLKHVLQPLLILVIAFAVGGYSLLQAESGNSLTLALFAGDQHEGVPADWEGVWAEYKASIFQTEEAADIIILPEKLFKIDAADVPNLMEDVQALARQKKALIVLGLDERGGKAYNRAYLLTGDAIHHYDKIHMIPGFEAHFTPGDTAFTVAFEEMTIGLAICKDLDFPGTISAYADTDLLLVPAWDFTEDDWFHSRMAMMRAIENGFTLARPARQGRLVIADSRGQVLGESHSGADAVTRLAGEYRITSKQTLYAQTGDLFAYLCLAALGVLMIRTLLLPKGERQH